MRDVDLFTAALALPAPWRVARSEFDAAARRLDLHLDFERGARFACPEGDEASCPVHDTEDKAWRHLDFFQHHAYLHARVPRVRCPVHGVRQVSVPWARPGSGFTLLFEALAMALLSEMPVRAVARIVGEHDTRLWRLLHHHVGRARQTVSMQKATAVGIDETSARRGQDYITIFCDLEEAKVLFATEGRSAAAVGAFASDLAAHGGDPARIDDVCCDMWRPWRQGVAAHLPNAAITYDRDHLAQMLSRAIDNVRRQEVRFRPELRRTRYLWLTRPDHLSQRQRAELAWICRQPHRARDRAGLPLAARLRRLLRRRPRGGPGIPRALVPGSDPLPHPAIRDFAYTVLDHFEGVLRWHRRRITIGLLEGINSLVQAAKRRARGYRSKRNLIAMVYLIAGKLDLGLTHSK